jgi:hypothetical protein
MESPLEEITWGVPGDGQGLRLVLAVALLVVVCLGAIIFGDDQGEPARGERPLRCEFEDEVMVRLEGDAFDLDAGELQCVHIDELLGAPQ